MDTLHEEAQMRQHIHVDFQQNSKLMAFILSIPMSVQFHLFQAISESVHRDIMVIFRQPNVLIIH